MAPTTPVKLRALAAAVLSATLALAPHAGSSTSAAGDGRGKPVVLVHGIDFVGCANTNGRQTWRQMKLELKAKGWDGGIWEVAYYECDTKYRHWINHHGSHFLHYSSGHTRKGGEIRNHSPDTSIRHLGYHLAWFIYDHFGTSCVEAVGHSMGGLLLRYAVAQMERGNDQFPTGVCVEDVVTFGTPHAGTPWARGCTWATQCVQMVNDDCDGGDGRASDFVKWIRKNAWAPDAGENTQWTLIASMDDGPVPESCGVFNMRSFSKVVYLDGEGIHHGDYMHVTSRKRTASVTVQEIGGHGWVDDRTAPWPVAYADQALRRGGW